MYENKRRAVRTGVKTSNVVVSSDAATWSESVNDEFFSYWAGERIPAWAFRTISGFEVAGVTLSAAQAVVCGALGCRDGGG